MKDISTLRTSRDIPLDYLCQQGHAWESLRAVYWSRRNPALAEDATQRAAYYEEQWSTLPETAHRSEMPKYRRQAS